MCLYVCSQVSAHESDDGLSVTYLTRPYIMASAVIRGTSFSQAEVSFFEDYDKQCSNVDFFSVLLLQFCLEYRGSAHGSYYPEGLGVLFHREKRGGDGDHLRIMPRAHFSPKPPVFSVAEGKA